MGGHVFGVVARRLTTEQHAALFRHALPLLQLFTHHRVVSPRTAGDKTTHGDLDILVGNWTEGQGFKYNFAVDAKEARELRTRPVDINHWRSIGDTRGHQWTVDEVKEWARSVATVLGATSWQNHQHGVSLAVPCDVLGDLVSDARPNEFFQIDIRMLRPDRFDFAVFIFSYGITAILLAQAVRCLSPALDIHHENLVIRHAPFPGLPAIEIELTANPTEMLDWLGLDEDRWSLGFDTQQDFWRWIASVDRKPEAVEPPIRQGWRAFAATTGEILKVKIRHQYPRFVEVYRFRDWLRTIYRESASETSGAAIGEDVAVTRGMSKTVSPGSQHSRTYTVTTKQTIHVDTETGAITSGPVETATAEVRSNRECDRSSATQTASSSIDPARPVPLDTFAAEALQRYGKTDAYQEALKASTAQAEEVHRKQERRQQNRAFAMEREDPAARLRVAQLDMFGKP